MWSPNELLKTEKQRDILSYITLQFFPFKKVPLEHYPKARGFFVSYIFLHFQHFSPEIFRISVQRVQKCRRLRFRLRLRCQVVWIFQIL